MSTEEMGSYGMDGGSWIHDEVNLEKKRDGRRKQPVPCYVPKKVGMDRPVGFGKSHAQRMS